MVLHQDNAHLHTARVSQDFLRHFQDLHWPASSPDLFPVEHVWYQLKRQIPSCPSVHDLEFTVQDLWAHLPQDNISFYNSKKCPPVQPRIEITTLGHLYAYLETQRMRYVTDKNSTNSSMGRKWFI
ncbi:DDE_3 domain-containing protein [Trichonephila clavipes]|nr:DDE_3 domain-containing protein [Trichonephila clavipes]